MTNHARLVRIFALCCGVAVACCCVLFGAAPALAEDSSLDELQQKVQETSEAYESAKSELEDVQAKIDENEQRIAELEAQIPDQRKKAADAISATYKMQQGGSSLITLLLSAEDFNEFVTTMSYLNVISSKNADALTELVSMQDELESTKAELQKERESAEDKLAEAQKAMQEATAAIRLPPECAVCASKHVCHACAAMCVTETGHFDIKPAYLCEMTRETVRLTLKEAEQH